MQDGLLHGALSAHSKMIEQSVRQCTGAVAIAYSEILLWVPNRVDKTQFSDVRETLQKRLG